MWKSNFSPIFILAKIELTRFSNEQCASREPFPAKPLRWHKLVPVGTGIAEVSVDLAPLPLTLVHQGRWATGGQLNSGHLLLQDDQTDRYISACWTSAAQLQPTASCFHTNAHSRLLLGATNVQSRAGYSSGRRMR